VKKLIIVVVTALLLLTGCAKEVTFKVFTEKTYLENVSVKSDRGILDAGELPFIVTEKEGETITATYNLSRIVTNFAVNHPQCVLIDKATRKYVETFTVNREDLELCK